ncbi:alpha-L-arabinofuranosidase [Dysgonomonas hofstadii]|uniref:non-reducing end alpha-L-arabinofuranosidase n=1 Tax=Dysgonomonas hofstadii TaxID=637886 RepID=A0A840CRN6_9BACT|nr:alpha-L-arabinofuranosidase C-terminal domain-containing protein [Dysgonomonas hofstadii]MBB4034413.1 alpha-L-arabinofuranosidase [Dysgonomonas hofstadii]
MKTGLCGIILCCLCYFVSAQPLTGQINNTYDGVLRIDKQKTTKVSPVKYGFHYEEIGMMGEGALHAELIRNRSFEEATPPADLAVKNELYQDVPNPRGKNKEVFHVDPLIGWTAYPLSYSPVFISRTAENPLNKDTKYSMLVNVTADIVSNPEAMILNRGYYGMNLKKDLYYNLSLYVKSLNYSASLQIMLVDEQGKPVSAPIVLDAKDKEWVKMSGTLKPDRNVKRGMLAIRPLAVGKFQLDVVSLFPSDTWDSGRSIFRADIVQNLKEYAPDFIRFPGGCIVHGVNEATMYHWKKTIGPTENRPGQWSKWAPYYRTDGIGYHEFYELCEYVGADAMYVTPTGMVCTGWVREKSFWNFIQPEVNLDAYIQDALDAIEYAIGPVTSKWGALRAQNGHPKAFPLKYIEIGNEDFGPVYWERYEKIYQALHKQYPDLIYIANSIIGKENTDKRIDIAKFVNPKNVKVFDEHHYQPVEWACKQHYRFDEYERGVADLFIGELGIDGKYPSNLLASGAVRMSLERNGDMNPLLAERPVMRHWDFMEHRNMQPMLINGVDCSIKTPFYYLSKMFRDNTFDVCLDASIQGMRGLQDVFVTLGYDSKSREYILKLVNLKKKEVKLRTEMKGFGKSMQAQKNILSLETDKNNTPETPDVVRPVQSTVSLNLNQDITIEASSMVVYRFK